MDRQLTSGDQKTLNFYAIPKLPFSPDKRYLEINPELLNIKSKYEYEQTVTLYILLFSITVSHKRNNDNLLR